MVPNHSRSKSMSCILLIHGVMDNKVEFSKQIMEEKKELKLSSYSLEQQYLI